jgi:hypothetical protein
MPDVNSIGAITGGLLPGSKKCRAAMIVTGPGIPQTGQKWHESGA